MTKNDTNLTPSHTHREHVFGDRWGYPGFVTVLTRDKAQAFHGSGKAYEVMISEAGKQCHLVTVNTDT
ncbi:MAG: hypothetical protein ACKODH_04265, partial [Limisphaerales bacterium]